MYLFIASYPRQSNTTFLIPDIQFDCAYTKTIHVYNVTTAVRPCEFLIVPHLNNRREPPQPWLNWYHHDLQKSELAVDSSSNQMISFTDKFSFIRQESFHNNHNGKILVSIYKQQIKLSILMRKRDTCTVSCKKIEIHHHLPYTGKQHISSSRDLAWYVIVHNIYICNRVMNSRRD